MSGAIAATGTGADLHRSLQAEVDSFMRSAAAEPPGQSLEDHIDFLVDFQRSLHEAGLAVVSWPVRFGGRDLGPDAGAVVAGRLGELGAPEVANYIGIEVLAPALLRFVDDERLTRWLPPMASASELWCQLFSEPDAGSDLAALNTRAVPDGDGWRITGQKIWSTWGQFAQWGVILTRTGTKEERHRGITAFVVDMSSDGIDARALRAMTGEEEFAEVFFDEVRVGPEALVGDVGGGWAVTMHVLAAERGPYAVHRASVLRKVLQGVVEHATRVALDPEGRQAVARAVIAVKLLDLQIARVVAALARGEFPGPEAAITKRMLSETEQRLLDAAYGLLGMAGVAWIDAPSPWVTAYLFSRAASIYGGSAQIQRNLIGERILGLPRS
jgi:alkylation response protein AidB-like acyl-CoA dehydrogenase